VQLLAAVNSSFPAAHLHCDHGTASTFDRLHQTGSIRILTDLSNSASGTLGTAPLLGTS
jgi:hypothetical protein